MTEKFVLKYGATDVADLEIDLLDGVVQQVQVLEPDLLPPGGNLSIEDLRKWWMRRAVPQFRGNIGTVLRQMGAANTQSLLLQNLGIGLTDHYWVKPAGSDLEWNNINPYENNFRDTIGELQFDSSGNYEYSGQSPFVPGASLQGELKKKWLIGAKGKRYLVKGNYGLSAQQSINEVIATKIHEAQGKMPYVSYQIFSIDTEQGSVTGCICENFANIEVEFIPAYDITSSIKKKNDVSEYESFIAVCQNHGLEEAAVRHFLEYQILTDYLITNTDRHFNNFGILRDTKTLKYIGMAPIFDSGNSMLWNRKQLPEEELLYQMPVSSFRKTELELLKYAKGYTVIDLNRLPADHAIQDLLIIDGMGEERVRMIMEWYQKKADVIHQLQSGRSLREIAGKVYIKPRKQSR